MTPHELSLVFRGHAAHVHEQNRLAAWHAAHVMSMWSTRPIRPTDLLPEVIDE